MQIVALIPTLFNFVWIVTGGISLNTSKLSIVKGSVGFKSRLSMPVFI